MDLLAKIDYTLDKVGNRKSKAQSVLNPLTENYNYDAVDQLIEAKYGTARTVGYQYDAVGNRQWVSDNGTTAHYTANSDNGYTSVGGAYAYDAQPVAVGQAREDCRRQPVGRDEQERASQNRLTTAIVNGVTTEFTYDSRNRVVQRTSGNGTLNLTYSGWHLIEERNATGALEQVYVHGAGTDEILVKITAAGPAYYHHDGLGSTIALTGENGGLLESYRYDAFGAATVYTNSGSALPASPRGNRFLFTGREWISQVGLYDYRNRVYSAQIGRFLQTDPIRFAAGDVNIYRYVSNNPVNFLDPTGEIGVPGAIIGGIGGAIAGGIGAKLSGGSWADIAKGATIGAASGAAMGAFTGGLGQVVAAGAAIGGISDVAGQLASGKSISELNGGQVAGATVGGALSGLAGGGLGKLGKLAGDSSLMPDVMGSIASIPLSIIPTTLGFVAGGCD